MVKVAGTGPVKLSGTEHQQTVTCLDEQVGPVIIGLQDGKAEIYIVF